MPALNVNVNVKDDVYKTYVKYTKMTGCTMNQVAENALTKYLDEILEDLDDLEAAEKAYAEFEASGQKTIPAEELYKELGL